MVFLMLQCATWDRNLGFGSIKNVDEFDDFGKDAFGRKFFKVGVLHSA